MCDLRESSRIPHEVRNDATHLVSLFEVEIAVHLVRDGFGRDGEDGAGEVAGEEFGRGEVGEGEEREVHELDVHGVEGGGVDAHEDVVGGGGRGDGEGGLLEGRGVGGDCVDPAFGLGCLCRALGGHGEWMCRETRFGWI